MLVLGLTACGAPATQAPCPETPTAPAPPAPTAEAPAATPEPPAPAAEPVELSYQKTLAGVTTIDQALEKVKAALEEQGFGIITKIDVQAVMKKKLDVELKPYWILGACNPKKANEAIEADSRMGLLLPCKVIVYQNPEGAFVVAFARPKAIFSLIDRPELSSLADDVELALRKAFDVL
ncbi:MAG: DUF302 domain-containing protein [Deltaproteobacteria bacterium]|nr:DUF302 domain-containing protein [Deltaproteobacteria bacterium]